MYLAKISQVLPWDRNSHRPAGIATLPRRKRETISDPCLLLAAVQIIAQQPGRSMTSARASSHAAGARSGFGGGSRHSTGMAHLTLDQLNSVDMFGSWPKCGSAWGLSERAYWTGPEDFTPAEFSSLPDCSNRSPL